jgi:AcrR family transcriptional regulator
MAPSDTANRQPARRLFPRLSSGAGQLSPEQVARHQKARLEGAMVEAVARHGYAATTLRELVALAGVSKSTFYDHFESKQDCFLATFDEIIARLRARVEESSAAGGDLHGRLAAGLDVFMTAAAEEPAAARLVAVESLTVGTAGIAHRERASMRFEVMLGKTLAKVPARRPVSAAAVVAIMAGVRNTVYRAARGDRIERLPEMVEPLVLWALSQGRPEDETTRAALAAARRPVDLGAYRPAPADASAPGWEEPPDSSLSRARLSQRERIVRAAAAVVIEHGYEGLSIPAISRAAGVSNQTFYEQFASKREPFVEAFEVLATDALASGIAAFAAAGSHAEAIGLGLRVLLEEIAANPRFARLAFFELPTAGPAALDRADAIFDGLARFLEPGAAPGSLGQPPPRPVLELIPGSIWNVIQREIVHDRRRELPRLAPELTRIVLAPFGPVSDRER